MATTEELLVKISADTDELKAGLEKAGDTVKEFSQSSIVSFEALDNMIEKWGGRLLGWGEKLSAMGSEVEQINAQFTRSMKAYGGSIEGITQQVEAFADTQMRAFGIDDDLVKKSIGNMADLGVSYQDTYKVFAVAADLAAAKNMDVESAVNLVTRAYNGNSQQLKRLGIDIADGAQGLVVLDSISARFAGAQEARSQTFAGAWDRMKVQIENIGEEIGVGLNNRLLFVVNAMAGAVDVVRDVLHTVWQAASEFFPLLWEFLMTGNTGVFQKMSEGTALQLELLVMGVQRIAITVTNLLGHVGVGIINMVSTAAEGMLNTIVFAINRIIDGYNWIAATIGISPIAPLMLDFSGVGARMEPTDLKVPEAFAEREGAIRGRLTQLGKASFGATPELNLPGSEGINYAAKNLGGGYIASTGVPTGAAAKPLPAISSAGTQPISLSNLPRLTAPTATPVAATQTGSEGSTRGDAAAVNSAWAGSGLDLKGVVKIIGPSRSMIVNTSAVDPGQIRQLAAAAMAAE